MAVNFSLIISGILFFLFHDFTFHSMVSFILKVSYSFNSAFSLGHFSSSPSSLALGFGEEKKERGK